MTFKAEILSRFEGDSDGSPFFLNDLSLWHKWQSERASLPPAWKDKTAIQIAKDLGMPVWMAIQPWHVEYPGIDVQVTQTQTEHIIRYETTKGLLAARWMIGRNGAWWQTDYPLTRQAALPAAIELAEAHTYNTDLANLERMESFIGEDGVLAIEIPRRPLSDMLHQYLGWSDGLLLFTDAANELQHIHAVLESKLQSLVQNLVDLPGDIVYSPDNLDGQFISPALFDAYLGESYATTANMLHQHGKWLLVHVGGPIRQIIAALVDSGVDGLQGICGPPQSDLSLVQARKITGPAVTLWGGIPQDELLQPGHSGALDDAIEKAVRLASGDPRMILGVADRVPETATLSMLQTLQDSFAQFTKRR